MSPEVAVRPHVVYRAYAGTGALLYIGCTSDLKGRLSAHRSTSQWHRLCHTVTVEHFADGPTAHAAEHKAIRSEGPVFNLVSTGRGHNYFNIQFREHDPNNIPQPLGLNEDAA